MTLAVQMAVLTEQMKHALLGMEEAREGRKEINTKLDNLSNSTLDMSHRLKAVEETLDKHKPTLDEFLMMKNRVEGAGVLGRWLWAFGGLLLAGVVFFRDQIRMLFPTP